MGREGLKIRRIGHDAMMEQDAGHRWKEDRSNRTPRHRSSSQFNAGKDMGKDGFYQGGPDTIEPKSGSDQLRAIYVAGRTPITVLQMGGRNRMSFLVMENLEDQFILGRDIVRKIYLMIDLNDGLIRSRNPDRKYVKRPEKRIVIDEKKILKNN